ncbi:MAG: cation transporter, partial [Treponema sp.]|nr:cation transporter [Treponema sp.]
MQSQTLSIGGMTCAACAGRIEKTVRKIEGVTGATVNLAGEKLFVEYADTRTLSAVKDAVVKIGYEVLEVSKDTVDEDKLRKEREIRILKTKFIVAAALGLPLLYIA